MRVSASPTPFRFRLDGRCEHGSHIAVLEHTVHAAQNPEQLAAHEDWLYDQGNAVSRT